VAAQLAASQEGLSSVSKQVRTSGVDWIDVAQDMDQWRALVNTLLNLRVSQNAGKFLSGCTIGGFSGRAQLRE
jgi:hypothetical protein